MSNHNKTVNPDIQTLQLRMSGFKKIIELQLLQSYFHTSKYILQHST